jgi:hypothetical protein
VNENSEQPNEISHELYLLDLHFGHVALLTDSIDYLTHLPSERAKSAKPKEPCKVPGKGGVPEEYEGDTTDKVEDERSFEYVVIGNVVPFNFVLHIPFKRSYESLENIDAPDHV